MTDLTPNPPLAQEPPPHFVVIVPGYMGSKLRNKTTSEIVWVDFQTLPLSPLGWAGWVDNLFDQMAYPNDNLEPAGIMEEVLFVPPWAKQEHYGRLIEALEAIGYVGDPSLPESERNLYTFSYDWRQDNRISGRELGQAVERWAALHPGAKAWLIGHSNGGIVSRWYIEKEGGAKRVSRLFLMASPWDGAPKATKIMFEGLETLFRGGFNLFNIQARTRNLIRTFPSAYQLIPVQDPFLHNLNNEVANPFDGRSWLDNPEQQAMLEDGKRFTEELGTTLSVETICIFGRKLPTLTNGALTTSPIGRWEQIAWQSLASGDGTVPERSAVHPNATTRLPFVATHGDIYVAPPVLEFLRWEMLDKYGGGFRAASMGEKFSVLFEPERDSYVPGETIRLHAQVLGEEEANGQRLAIDNANILARLVWKQPLPGNDPAQIQLGLARTRLGPTGNPGEYTGNLIAPAAQGYYDLVSVIDAPGMEPITLSEMILIEEV
jgi:pimeloyl-ACP methyl ester carboxylesterase